MSDPWADANDLADQAAADLRDEAATDRHSAFIPDDPRRPDSFNDDEGLG